jgi:hypothetical protein
MIKEINLLLIIEYVVVLFLLTELIQFIGYIINTYEPKNKYINIFKKLLVELLTCPKCSSFWITLIISQNIFLAAIVSLLIKYLKYIEEKIIKYKLD